MLWHNQEVAATVEERKDNDGEEEEQQEEVMSQARTMKTGVCDFNTTCCDLCN